MNKLQFFNSNSKIAADIVKNLYNNIKELANFVTLSNLLIENIDNFAAFIETKALKIVKESLSKKFKIPLKELFTPGLFSNVQNVTVKDYYAIAFEMVKPNLSKLFAHPESKVSEIAVMIRYAFGSDNTFYHATFEEYLHNEIKKYQERYYDEK